MTDGLDATARMVHGKAGGATRATIWSSALTSLSTPSQRQLRVQLKMLHAVDEQASDKGLKARVIVGYQALFWEPIAEESLGFAEGEPLATMS